jgi:hypothetical protein
VGQQVVATRQLPSKRFVCDRHWRSRLGIPTKEPAAQPPAPIAPAQPVERRETPRGNSIVKKIADVTHATLRGEKKKMLDQNTIDGIKRDAAAGMNLSRIAEKHSISIPTAKKYAGDAAPAPTRKPRAIKKTGRAQGRRSSADYLLLLDRFKGERAALKEQLEHMDLVIAALEKLVKG